MPGKAHQRSVVTTFLFKKTLTHNNSTFIIIRDFSDTNISVACSVRFITRGAYYSWCRASPCEGSWWWVPWHRRSWKLWKVYCLKCENTFHLNCTSMSQQHLIISAIFTLILPLISHGNTCFKLLFSWCVILVYACIFLFLPSYWYSIFPTIVSNEAITAKILKKYQI